MVHPAAIEIKRFCAARGLACCRTSFQVHGFDSEHDERTVVNQFILRSHCRNAELRRYRLHLLGRQYHTRRYPAGSRISSQAIRRSSRQAILPAPINPIFMLFFLCCILLGDGRHGFGGVPTFALASRTCSRVSSVMHFLGALWLRTGRSPCRHPRSDARSCARRK